MPPRTPHHNLVHHDLLTRLEALADPTLHHPSDPCFLESVPSADDVSEFLYGLEDLSDGPIEERFQFSDRDGSISFVYVPHPTPENPRVSHHTHLITTTQDYTFRCTDTFEDGWKDPVRIKRTDLIPTLVNPDFAIFDDVQRYLLTRSPHYLHYVHFLVNDFDIPVYIVETAPRHKPDREPDLGAVDISDWPEQDPRNPRTHLRRRASRIEITLWAVLTLVAPEEEHDASRLNFIRIAIAAANGPTAPLTPDVSTAIPAISTSHPSSSQPVTASNATTSVPPIASTGSTSPVASTPGLSSVVVVPAMPDDLPTTMEVPVEPRGPHAPSTGTSTSLDKPPSRGHYFHPFWHYFRRVKPSPVSISTPDPVSTTHRAVELTLIPGYNIYHLLLNRHATYRDGRARYPLIRAALMDNSLLRPWSLAATQAGATRSFRLELTEATRQTTPSLPPSSVDNIRRLGFTVIATLVTSSLGFLYMLRLTANAKEDVPAIAIGIFFGLLTPAFLFWTRVATGGFSPLAVLRWKRPPDARMLLEWAEDEPKGCGARVMAVMARPSQLYWHGDGLSFTGIEYHGDHQFNLPLFRISELLDAGFQTGYATDGREVLVTPEGVRLRLRGVGQGRRGVFEAMGEERTVDGAFIHGARGVWWRDLEVGMEGDLGDHR